LDKLPSFDTGEAPRRSTSSLDATVTSPELPNLALPSSGVWLVINLVGAATFLWGSNQLWARRDEGYTFGDGELLFYLTVIFAMSNITLLVLKTVVAVQVRDWRVTSGPMVALVIWGAVVGYHFLRIKGYALHM
jgi:hypothetical protein